jgi:hypothetical protein
VRDSKSAARNKSRAQQVREQEEAELVAAFGKLSSGNVSMVDIMRQKRALQAGGGAAYKELDDDDGSSDGAFSDAQSMVCVCVCVCVCVMVCV